MPMGSQDFWYNPTWGPENGSILISLVPTSASPGHKCCKSKISSPACMPSMQDRQGRARGGVERLLWRSVRLWAAFVLGRLPRERSGETRGPPGPSTLAATPCPALVF